MPPEQAAPLVELAHVPVPVLVPRELVSVRQGQVVPPAESECVRVPEQAQRAWAWVQRA